MLDLKEVQKTREWELYQKAIQHMYLFNFYEDTNKNYRFYNGDQWAGLKIKDVEPVQLNFIQTIIDYKVAVINQNNWGIVYSSENFEDEKFKPVADKLCRLLNLKANRIWKRSKMDTLIRQLTIDSAVNDEGVIYSYWDKEKEEIKNELIEKTDIFYGNENSSDIQSQPYILIRQRVPVVTVREMAKNRGLSEEKVNQILGDNDNLYNVGDNGEYEKDEACTIVIKMWKEDEIVHFSKATQLVQLEEDINTGMKRYPIAHMVWSEKKGCARGEGVVRNLIPNQIEVNKILMRRAVVTKNTAYPQKVVNIDNVQNPQELNRVGGIIKVTGTTESVSNVFQMTNPAQMSTDVDRLQSDLIDLSRNLQNAGDISTGSINPEDASGKAILAVQNASRQTLNNQVQQLKDCIEQIALNWIDEIINYSNGMILQDEETDPRTGKKQLYNIKVDKASIKKLKASVTIEVTPMSAYDQYAQELSLENLLKEGWFSPEKIDQLQLYAESLPEKSTMPKQKILDICKKVKEQQLYIQQLQAQTNLMTQKANQYIDMQAQQVGENAAGMNIDDDEILKDADRQAYEDALAEFENQ